jgi:hypothetical protein
MTASSQTISRKVMGTSGGNFTQGNYSLSFTIGETVIPTVSAPGYVITQGFQQPELPVSTGNGNFQGLVMNLNAYPEDKAAKLVLETKTSDKTVALEVERLNNLTGQYEVIERRNDIKLEDKLSTYSFVDKNQQDGDNYYRVKQVTLDNKASYSQIRKVKFTPSDLVNLFPNPADEYVDIDLKNLTSKDVTIYIYSPLGQLMVTKQVENVGSKVVRIPVNGFETGLYQVRFNVNGKIGFPKQLMIAR